MSARIRRGLATLFSLAFLSLPAGTAWGQAGESAPGYSVPLLADPGVSFLRVPPPPETQGLMAQGFAALQATIVVNYLSSGTMFNKTCAPWSPQAQAAFGYAVSLWAARIQSSVPITVNACWAVLDPGVLGRAGPYQMWRDFPGAPVAGTSYPVALANALSGSDRNGSAPEIEAQFGSTFNWYLGTDGNTPSDRYDFVSVVMHELGHGLGFLGSMWPGSPYCPAGTGCWGYGSGFPYIYDRFTENGSNQPLLTAFANNSTALAAQLVSNNLFFDGTNSRAANGNAPVPLYAPSVWNGGSSYSHLAESFNGTANALMTYSLSNGESIHDPGPVALGILKDSGWALETVASAGALSLNLAGTAASIPVTTGSTTFSVARTGGTSGAVSATLGVTGGCTLSTASASFASGSTTPAPATVTVSAGSAAGGATCTVSLTAVSPATTGSPSTHSISVIVGDTTPNAFGFTSQTGLVPESTVTSNTVTPTGYNAAATISVANGSYSIGCSEPGFTSSAGTISPGQSVCVRHAASPSFGATVTTTLTIGGVAGGFSSTTVASLGTALSNGVAVSNLSGAAGSSAYYYIDVPTGATSLSVVTSVGGRSADLNLYVRRNGVPTTVLRDCASANVGTTAESCSFTSPPAGRYYILLAGMAPAGYSAVSLTATYVASGGSPGELSMNLSGTAASIAAGGGSTTFSVVRTGGTSGAATANLTVSGGCALSTPGVSFASGSSTPSPATVTLSSGTAASGGSCTVGMSATGASLSLSAPVAFAVTITGSAPPPPSGTPLANGVAVTNLSGALGSSAYYYIDVPSGATSLVVQTAGGTGDADLFVRRDLPPDRGNGLYDCGSQGGSNVETCSFTNPPAGRYYVLLYGFAAFSGASLTATYTAAPPPPSATPLANGVAVTGLAGATGSSLYYYIDVPSGATSLTVQTAGGSGGRGDTSNVNLYVRRDAMPTTTAYDCASAGATSSESCPFTNPPAGRYYVLLYAAAAYTGGSVVATYATAPPPSPGSLSLNASGTAPTIPVTTGSTAFSVVRTGGTSGAATGNLAVSGGCTLSTASVSFASGSSTPSPATVTLSAGSAAIGALCTVSLTASGATLGTPSALSVGITATPPPPSGTPLANGVAVTNLSGALGSSVYYYIDVPSGATSLVVQTAGGTGDADIYVRRDFLPDRGNGIYECGSLSGTNAETCSFTNPPAGRYYVLLYGYAAFSGVSLTATYTAAPPPPSATPLANGVAVTGLAGATGSSLYYYIDVPSGATSLTVQTAGGSGGRGDTSNVNLYVRRDAMPTTTAYDCASAGATSSESCPFTNPPAGRYYVLLYAAAAYTGGSVVATYVAAPPPSPGSLSLDLSSTATMMPVTTGSTPIAVARTGGTSGTVTGNLGVTGGCTLSATSVSFAGGSTTPAPATVTVSAGSAAGGSNCTVTLTAVSPATTGTPSAHTIAITTATPPPPSGTPLSNGVAVTGLSGATGSSLYFYIDVPPSSSLVVQTAGGGGRGDTGNVNLYVRRDAVPTPSAYECGSTGTTSTESCTYISPPAGRYHILLYGAAAFTGVSVQATFVALTGSPGELSMNLSGTAGSIAAGGGSTTFSVVRSGGTAGPATANLSVSGGCALSTPSVAFASGSATPSPATVTISSGTAASGGSCTVGMSATGASLALGVPVGFTVTISGSAPPPPSATPLANGVAVTNLSGATGSSAHYYIDVPSGALGLVVQTAGGTGDADLLVRYGSPVELSPGGYNCASGSLTTVESCAFTLPPAGRYYVLLYGFTAFSGVSLTASYTLGGR